MKLLRSSIALATFACVVQLFLATPIQAASVKSDRAASFPRVTTSLPVGSKVTVIGELVVDCHQHPSPKILANWAKDHICGQGSGTESSAAQPDGSVTSDCGTVSNSLSNAYGGNAFSTVSINPSWISGGMNSANYTVSWYNGTTNSGSGYGDANSWTFPNFAWNDKKLVTTGAGTVTAVVTVESASTVLYGTCVLTHPIAATANIS